MKFRDYADREQMMMGLADVVASELTMALIQNEEVLMAVPGGTTPGPAFDCLSGVSLEWSKVCLTLTDERWVPESDARSNARLVREHFLVGRAAEACFLPLYAEGGGPEEHVADFAARIEPRLPVAVALLGMGEDMHTASLFPGMPELEAALAPDAPAVLATHPQGEPEPRVSLSARVLNGALSKHLIITGAQKRAALEQARALRDPMQAPILAVLDGATVHWAP